MKPSIGRIVHFVRPDGQVRPAMIVRVWSDICVQLQVFTDGMNDGAHAGLEWKTSVTLGTKPGTWQWPAIADAPAAEPKAPPPPAKPAAQSVAPEAVASEETVNAV